MRLILCLLFLIGGASIAHAAEKGEVGPPSEPSRVWIEGDKIHYLVPNSRLIQMEEEAPSWLLLEVILGEGQDRYKVRIQIPSAALPADLGDTTMIDSRAAGQALSLTALGLSRFASAESIEVDVVSALHHKEVISTKCEPDQLCYDKVRLVCSSTEVVGPSFVEPRPLLYIPAIDTPMPQMQLGDVRSFVRINNHCTRRVYVGTSINLVQGSGPVDPPKGGPKGGCHY